MAQLCGEITFARLFCNSGNQKLIQAFVFRTSKRDCLVNPAKYVAALAVTTSALS